MRRLVAVLGATLALLAALDLGVARYLARQASPQDPDALRTRTFRQLAFLQFAQLIGDARGAAVRAYERWSQLPKRKAPHESRVFFVSDSAGLFAVEPRLVEARLRDAVPGQAVSVTSLMVPGAHAGDLEHLVQAALAKEADVVVTLIGLVSLSAERSFGTDLIEDLFDLPRTGSGASSFEARADRFLVRNWRLYRARGLLRAETSRLMARVTGRAEREGARVEAAFTAIQAAARSKDVAAVVRAYREHSFPGLPGRVTPPPLHPDVVAALERSAREVEAAGTIGVAVFLPVNPIFRDPAAERDGNRVDDAAVKERARSVLDIFRAHGWAVEDDIDALPPEDFIDLVHVNGDGMERFGVKLIPLVLNAVTGASS